LYLGEGFQVMMVKSGILTGDVFGGDPDYLFISPGMVEIQQLLLGMDGCMDRKKYNDRQK
jgi:hypothetical protein